MTIWWAAWSIQQLICFESYNNKLILLLPLPFEILENVLSNYSNVNVLDKRHLACRPFGRWKCSFEWTFILICGFWCFLHLFNSKINCIHTCFQIHWSIHCCCVRTVNWLIFINFFPVMWTNLTLVIQICELFKSKKLLGMYKALQSAM